MLPGTGAGWDMPPSRHLAGDATHGAVPTASPLRGSRRSTMVLVIFSRFNKDLLLVPRLKHFGFLPASLEPK